MRVRVRVRVRVNLWEITLRSDRGAIRNTPRTSVVSQPSSPPPPRTPLFYYLLPRERSVRPAPFVFIY